MKTLSTKSLLLCTPGITKRRARDVKRKMSVKGAIKKTRSINVDCKYIHTFVHQTRLIYM